MTKKFFVWSLFSALLIGMMSIGVVSCGDDDDDSPSSGGGDDGGNASVLAGVWSYTYWEDEDKVELLLTFFDNGTGIYAEVETDEDGEIDSDGSTFVYQINGSNGTITLDYGSSSYYYSSSNKENYSFKFENGKITVANILTYSSYYYYNRGRTTAVFSKISNLGNNAGVEGTWTIYDRILEFQAGGKGFIKRNGRSTEEFNYQVINETEGIIEYQESDYYYSGSSTKYFKYRIVGKRMYLFDGAPWIDLDYMLIKQ